MKAFRQLRTAICALLAVSLTLALSGCAGESQAREPQGKAYFTYFDTVSYIYSYAGDTAEQFDSRCAQVSELLSEYHQLFDIYHEYTGVNNLCTVNRLAGGDPVPVDKRLVDFLLYARELYHETQGEMNVMLGAALSVWHDCRAAALDNPASAALPAEEALFRAGEHTDISLLEIDEEKLTVRISDPEASIDVGALGKGYAAERAAELLGSLGAQGYVLNMGGNIRAVGAKPDGSGWTTGVRDPDGAADSFAARLDLQDTSCVTSGVYERYFTVAGVRYHHIIDKDTLYPAEYFASVTVVTRDSALADALSTALFCMPYEDGLALVEELGNVDVLWIYPGGEQKYTSGMSQRIIP